MPYRKKVVIVGKKSGHHRSRSVDPSGRPAADRPRMGTRARIGARPSGMDFRSVRGPWGIMVGPSGSIFGPGSGRRSRPRFRVRFPTAISPPKRLIREKCGFKGDRKLPTRCPDRLASGTKWARIGRIFPFKKKLALDRHSGYDLFEI